MKTLNKNVYFLQDNIFQSTLDKINYPSSRCSIIIPHVCNNINVFGAGFAKAVADTYPEVKDNYHLLGKSFLKNNLGYVQFVEVAKSKNIQNKNKLIIANMIAQNGLPSFENKKPLHYGALVSCMYKVKSYLTELAKTSSFEAQELEIHCPKFGSGIAGGNWNFINDLIKDIWCDQFPVFVYSPAK